MMYRTNTDKTVPCTKYYTAKLSICTSVQQNSLNSLYSIRRIQLLSILFRNLYSHVIYCKYFFVLILFHHYLLFDDGH